MTTLSVNLVPSEVAGSGTWAEKLETILTTAVGGFLLVFLVLAIIWLLLELLGRFFAKGVTGPAKMVEELTPSPRPEPVVTAAPSAPASSEEEIVAAIVAAISAHTGKPVGRFRVVSFRKKR